MSFLFESFTVVPYEDTGQINRDDRVRYRPRVPLTAKPNLASVEEVWRPRSGITRVFLNFFGIQDRIEEVNGQVLVSGRDKKRFYEGKLVYSGRLVQVAEDVATVEATSNSSQGRVGVTQLQKGSKIPGFNIHGRPLKVGYELARRVDTAEGSQIVRGRIIGTHIAEFAEGIIQQLALLGEDKQPFYIPRSEIIGDSSPWTVERTRIGRRIIRVPAFFKK